MDEVQSALGHYKAEARELDSARRGAFSEAVRHLQNVVSNAKAYRAITIQSGASDDMSGGVAAQQAPIDEPDISATPLPPDFAWVPLSRIAPDQFVDFSVDPPKGVEAQTIERGMRRFYADVLPILNGSPDTTFDDLVEIDRAQGTLWTTDGLVHPESLSNLSEIFLFGGDVMAGYVDAAGEYHLHSGRHRATMARSLGMTHVPILVARRRERE
jgi:hypothetical protein